MNLKKKLDKPNQLAECFNRRISAAYLFFLFGFLLLVGRLFYLQIIQHEKYLLLSEQNHIALIPINAQRGIIFDRHGKALVENRPVFNLNVIPENASNIEAQLTTLDAIINIPPKIKKHFKRNITQQKPFTLMTLKEHLSEKEVARFSAHQSAFPAFNITAETQRYYPYGPLLSHVLGYVQLQKPQETQHDQNAYRFSSFKGQTGIEAQENDRLKGNPGYEVLEVDAKGRPMRITEKKPEEPGTPLYLTLDLKTQQAADKALGKHKGAVVAINPQTGGILAMVSHPNFDPNHPRRQKGYSMFNRAVSGQYPPGSTIKPFIALGALKEHTIETDTYIDDPGYYKIPGASNIYRDWDVHGHGHVAVTKAIQVSCDTFFYVLARALGIQKIGDILSGFGFGQATGLGYGQKGLIPSPAWKKQKHHQPWYVGDTIITGIGQGSLLATPLQMARATAILSMHGLAFPLHWVQHEASNPKNTTPKQTIEASGAHWNIIIDAMKHALIEGTGFHFGPLTHYDAAGKTGTVQLVRHHEAFNDKNLPEHLRNHALFLVFAPIKDPKIAVSVLVENNPGASEIARKVVDAYMRTRQQKEAPKHAS